MNRLRTVATGFAVAVMALSMSGISKTAQAQDSSTAPKLVKAMAKNTGGTSAKEAGDTVLLKFSESTNKFAITSANIGTEFGLTNSHSFLDGSGALGGATWNESGTELEIALSDGTSLPSVMPGDGISINGGDIKDIDGNSFTGSVLIGGSFTVLKDDSCVMPTPTATPTPTPTPSATPTPTQTINATSHGSDDEDINDNENEDEDVNDDSIVSRKHNESDEDNDCDHHEDHGKFRCGTGLQNGKLFKLEGSPTVYMLVACKFKPFRGEAAFHSRGLKFQDIQILKAFPVGMVVSTEPVVPAEGTLIKGTDKTVWFVDANGKRRGFTSAEVFSKLGFSFNKVDVISDSDLSTVSVDTPINDDTHHPDGALVKCGTSADVFVVIGNMRFPFANANAFNSHGHRFDHILNVDCGRFAYKQGAAITQ